MALQSDFWVGLGKEATWGTAVTPTTFLFGTGKIALEVQTTDGKGYRPLTRAVDAARHTVTRHKVSGDVSDMDAVIPGGLKVLLEAAFGVCATGVVDATSGIKQHLFGPLTGDCLPSYTIQQSTPRVGCGTASDVATFAGCQCTSLKLSGKSGELLGVETSWVGKSQSFTASAGVPSYPASPDQLAFSDGVMTWGGTVTMPTTTTLATGGTALLGVRSFDMEISNGLDDNEPTLGSGLYASRAAMIEGKEFCKGSFEREYLDRSLIDDVITQTPRPVTWTFTGRGPSTTAPFLLQLFAPAVVLSSPASVEPNDAKVITQKHDFTVLQPATGAPLYAVLRTTEA